VTKERRFIISQCLALLRLERRIASVEQAFGIEKPKDRHRSSHIVPSARVFLGMLLLVSSLCAPCRMRKRRPARKRSKMRRRNHGNHSTSSKAAPLIPFSWLLPSHRWARDDQPAKNNQGDFSNNDRSPLASRLRVVSPSYPPFSHNVTRSLARAGCRIFISTREVR